MALGSPGVSRSTLARATLGRSRRSRASSASTWLTTNPGEPSGVQALHHDRVRGQGEDRARGSGRRRRSPPAPTTTKGWASE